MSAIPFSPFRLHPRIDAGAAREAFLRSGHVQIAPFLDGEGAEQLLRHLEERGDWRLVLNAGEKVYEIDRAGQQSLTQAQRDEMEKRVLAAATSGFQYRFETIRVADDEAGRAASASLLDQLASFLSSAPVLALLRQVSGCGRIDFADAQATCYRAGHFLTRHDDDVEGKGRRAAYVFGLTGSWRPEWGGLLLFHAPDSNIEHGYLPRMNALTLFAVPRAHSVSLIAPFAGRPRYSVTGWLRSRLAAPQQ